MDIRNANGNIDQSNPEEVEKVRVQTLEDITEKYTSGVLCTTAGVKISDPENPLSFESQAARAEAIKVDLYQHIKSLVCGLDNHLDAIKRVIFYNANDEKLASKGKQLPNWPHCEVPEGLSAAFADADKDLMLFMHGVIGRATEAGEMLSLLMTLLENYKAGDGLSKLDRINLNEELGDDAFYEHLIMYATGLNPLNKYQTNQAKLLGAGGRYEKGFSTEAALDRDTEKEREILSQNTK